MELPAEPEIVLTNDDGIDAPGIRALYDALSTVGSVTVVAPDRDRSAVGRSLSYGRTGSTDEPDFSGDGESSAIDMADGQFTSLVPTRTTNSATPSTGRPVTVPSSASTPSSQHPISSSRAVTTERIWGPTSSHVREP